MVLILGRRRGRETEDWVKRVREIGKMDEKEDVRTSLELPRLFVAALGIWGFAG